MSHHKENISIIAIKESDMLSITAHNTPGTVKNTEYLMQVCWKLNKKQECRLSGFPKGPDWKSLG